MHVNDVLRLVIVAASVVTVLGTLEIAARLYVRVHTLPHVYPAEIVDEENRLTFHLATEGVFVPDDFHGQFITVESGQRRTVGQPQRYTHTVWLFGNSSVFDYDVADADTIASQLQAMLQGVRVVNLGVAGEQIFQELLREKAAALNPGDAVIFIDGALESRSARTCDWQVPSALIQVMCDATNTLPSRNLDSAVVDYLSAQGKARAYARSHGALFLHFLQPTPGTSPFLERVALDGSPVLHVPPGDFVDDPHLNAAGDAIVVAALYRALVEF